MHKRLSSNVTTLFQKRDEINQTSSRLRQLQGKGKKEHNPFQRLHGEELSRVDALKKAVFLTGATGFIGTQIMRYLLQNDEVTILALVRAANLEEAQRKASRNWWDWPELIGAMGSRIEVVCGDVRIAQFGLGDKEFEALTHRVTHIIHSAADWRLLSVEELRKTNVQGTANVLAFAKKINQHHRLERLSHISTAYVAGGRAGRVPEDALTDEFGFSITYERSKYEGELLVQEAKKDLSISVFRPSMVVGDSQTGAIKTFNTFYFPLRLCLTGKMRLLPVKKSLKVNIVPVDYVAKAVVQLTFDPRAEGKNFHLVTPQENLLTIGEIGKLVQKWAEANLRIKIPTPLYVSMSPSTLRRVLKLQQAFKGRDTHRSNVLEALAPYFSENKQFQTENINELFGPCAINWEKTLPLLLEYATYNSFFHRSDRTVYEQVLFRLESKSNPIQLYDIVEGNVIPLSAEDMRKDILKAAAALKAMGIGKGDRVAITGLNCTKYFIADIAIGILGAVSVPLYYTSPPADIDPILKASGSKMLFVGITGLLQRIDELQADIPIVYFTRSSASSSRKNLVSWADFLSTAKIELDSYYSPVDFDDIATLRYSSGTTGKPKGAVFNHANLRYMGESLVSITPWRTRHGNCSYLSFLPMGHVIEGILATYSPYYAPANMKIYFLEDFRKLQDALPVVRPNIFFAVPRIYEKIWENLGKNKIGNVYIHRKKGPLKWLLGRLLKRMMLKRAGLDKCAQLIAGSATFDEHLLLNFRELGVEIHNAYGLTEAPLVTLNRVGRNRIGAVGEPMPFTKLQIANDGEIMVNGPQVTVGYFEKALKHPLEGGWLMTGDTGKITDEGSLVIFGRKKEVIKTAYGKCIYSGKIESMIKEIRGVSEVLVVGEAKPYCVALIWVQKNKLNDETSKKIDVAIEKMNENLSHPEKIKRWALLVNNLSIEDEDLTPNLKLKRNVVEEKNAQIISALYGDATPNEQIHIGTEKTE